MSTAILDPFIQGYTDPEFDGRSYRLKCSAALFSLEAGSTPYSIPAGGGFKSPTWYYFLNPSLFTALLLFSVSLGVF